jgi:hypothetical protein
MMNILPRNPADREAKSPCDKNIPCVFQDVIHRIGKISVIVVYDKEKTALVYDPSDLINTCLWPGDNLLV